ncbi:MAG: hypothetical protein K2X55_19670 [Burkholderiaceae bacterium]|nr:hypothetical protein [Burkholderiaceae bacterium]
MKTIHRLAAIILAVSCAAVAAPKKPGPPRYGMAVYSDLCIHQQSGEFGGRRVTVQRFAEVDTVIYEYTAGGLSWPIVADDVQIGPHGDKIIFTLQLEGEEKTLSGTLVEQGAALVLDGGHCGQPDTPARLNKVRDFGRNPPACKTCPLRKDVPPPEAPQSPQSPQAPVTPAA